MSKIMFTFVLMLVLVSCNANDERVNVLGATSDASLLIADFSKPIKLSPIEPGWHHREFMFVSPMDVSFEEYKAQSAIKLQTNDSASILRRYTDIPLKDFPILKWRWLIKQQIQSKVDETQGRGDDAAARLIIAFSDTAGDNHSFEIIWARQLKSGDRKFTHDYNHYVARGANDPLDRWLDDELDIEKLYKEFWPEKTGATITSIGVFSDTDNTAASSVAFFSRIELLTR